MTQFTTAMDTALAGFSATVFGAVEILLPSYSLRLLDGAGTLTIGGNVFTGQDATFGTLASIDVIADGSGDDAPEVTITLFPASDVAAASLAAANMQGSKVSIWVGAVNPATGLVIPDPLLIFSGIVDQPTLKSGPHTRSLEFICASAFENFFGADRGARLSDAFHQYVWPGETGMSQATGVTFQLYWGTDSPSGVVKPGIKASLARNGIVL